MIAIDDKEFNIEKIAESGQCFRMTEINNTGKWQILAGVNFCVAEKDGSNWLLDCSKEDYENIWHPYFDMDTDYGAIRASIAPEDKFLTTAAEFSRGIRILNQDSWEMLISFIISQRKNIPAIRSCVEKISRLCGPQIGENAQGPIFGFPEPAALANIKDEELCSCSLGYRADYVKKAAIAVADGSVDLKAMEKLTDGELLEELLKIRGVGIKVANCVSLFGFHRVGAFPIDVWIKRVIDEIYGGSFDQSKYQGYAGIIQQYMFFYGRSTL